MKWLLLVAVIVMALPMPVLAADVEAGYAEYEQGRGRVAPYFFALYDEFVVRVRFAEILRKCGYKKEGDELSASTTELAMKKLLALIDKDTKDKTLQSMAAFHVAHEGASSMLFGYSLGYREALSLTADSIPAGAYESLCKSSLTKAREWMKENK